MSRELLSYSSILQHKIRFPFRSPYFEGFVVLSGRLRTSSTQSWSVLVKASHSSKLLAMLLSRFFSKILPATHAVNRSVSKLSRICRRSGVLVCGHVTRTSQGRCCAKQNCAKQKIVALHVGRIMCPSGTLHIRQWKTCNAWNQRPHQVVFG